MAFSLDTTGITSTIRSCLPLGLGACSNRDLPSSVVEILFDFCEFNIGLGRFLEPLGLPRFLFTGSNPCELCQWTKFVMVQENKLYAILGLLPRYIKVFENEFGFLKRDFEYYRLQLLCCC